MKKQPFSKSDVLCNGSDMHLVKKVEQKSNVHYKPFFQSQDRYFLTQKMPKPQNL